MYFIMDTKMGSKMGFGFVSFINFLSYNLLISLYYFLKMYLKVSLVFIYMCLVLELTVNAFIFCFLI